MARISRTTFDGRDLLIIRPGWDRPCEISVIALHGLSWSIDYFSGKCNFAELADITGAAFYIPQGRGRVADYNTPKDYWRAPRGLPWGFANWQYRDKEFRFFGSNPDVTLLTNLAEYALTNNGPLVLFGFSAGAVMVNYLLSSDLSTELQRMLDTAIYYSSAYAFDPTDDTKNIKVWSALNTNDPLAGLHSLQDKQYAKHCPFTTSRYMGGGHSIHPSFLWDFEKLLRTKR